MKKGSLWYSANEDQVNVVRSFGWHCHGLQPGQSITYDSARHRPTQHLPVGKDHLGEG